MSCGMTSGWWLSDKVVRVSLSEEVTFELILDGKIEPCDDLWKQGASQAQGTESKKILRLDQGLPVMSQAWLKGPIWLEHSEQRRGWWWSWGSLQVPDLPGHDKEVGFYSIERHHKVRSKKGLELMHVKHWLVGNGLWWARVKTRWEPVEVSQVSNKCLLSAWSHARRWRHHSPGPQGLTVYRAGNRPLQNWGTHAWTWCLKLGHWVLKVPNFLSKITLLLGEASKACL